MPQYRVPLFGSIDGINRPALRISHTRCKICLMRFRVTCALLLLLLLVGLQVSAATCAIRCGMENMDSPSQVTGIAHRSRMAFPTGSGQEPLAASTLFQPCDSHVCDSDWTFLQNRDVHELGVVSLPISLAMHAAPSVLIPRYSPFQGIRSTHSIPPFDPLVSNLRI